MNKWLQEHLVCPRDHQRLRIEGDALLCPSGHSYPYVDGVPVMLVDDAQPTHTGAVEATRKWVGSERPAQPQLSAAGVDPYVQQIVGATSGNLYGPLIGKLKQYPIPEFRLSSSNGEYLLDIGCNWGRWSVSAARKGYIPVGIDPSLDAIFSAQRVARQLGVTAIYLVADARYLPFASGSFDVVFSYSVLQHFSKENVRIALAEAARVMKPSGQCLIQMPNAIGVRSGYHQVRRGFKEGEGFDVRFWTPTELKRTFENIIGPSSLSIDGFFGLGIQKSDVKMLRPHHQAVVYASELLRYVAQRMQFMKYVADSLYVHSTLRTDGRRRT